jgi:TPR repeat protein
MAQSPIVSNDIPQISQEQQSWLQKQPNKEDETVWNGRQSDSSLQKTPPRPTASVKRKAVPGVAVEEAQLDRSIMTSDMPSLRLGDEKGSATERESGSSLGLPTPDSTPQLELPIRLKMTNGQSALSVEDQSMSRASSGSYPRIEEDEEWVTEPVQEQEGLQYHAFDDAPKKKLQNQVSHAANHSVSSSSSGGDARISQQLGVPKAVANLQRPQSQHSLGAELRGRTLSPLSANGSEHSSPSGYPRDLSNSRRSPASRPSSYMDLLSNVPYNQQVAPAGQLQHQSLQSAIGSAASLLDMKKTLEMYRANVKKTNDAAVQYEFAIYMISCSQDPELTADIDPNQLVKEAKEILTDLASRSYPFAQYYLADGLASGLFNKGKPDLSRAFHLFQSASKHSHAEAGYRTALCYEFGWGTGKSVPKAVQYYRAAAFKNHPGAATRLGMACLRNDMGLFGKDKYREGVKWLKRAQESADFQYNAAPFELGVLHLTGFGDDIFKDEQYAAQLFTQSAELGHVQANFIMGEAYENGLYGCPKDAALSVHFYNGAATRGHAEAMMALCAWYMVGAEPVLEKDEREACEWAKQAAETGKTYPICPSQSSLLAVY